MSYTLATAICKAEFETYLTQVGTSATWYQRNSTVPASGSAISAAAAHLDPTDAAFVPEPGAASLFTPKGKVLVAKDIPSGLQAEAAGQMISGQTIGYTKTVNVIATGDLLDWSGEKWKVIGARAVSPAIYRELTLERL